MEDALGLVDFIPPNLVVNNLVSIHIAGASLGEYILSFIPGVMPLCVKGKQLPINQGMITIRWRVANIMKHFCEFCYKLQYQLYR